MLYFSECQNTFYNQMPPKPKPYKKDKPKQQIKEEEIETQAQLEDQNNQKAVEDNIVNAYEISATEAESYFQYLRKKIAHQSKDPFSLPFLNLKFEQLQSWKGATEQLNLQSKIYGMRVDNCHDYTVTMLNHVIRNQQLEMQNNQKSADQQLTEQKKQKGQPYCSYLQKPQKLVCELQIDKNIHNRSIWKAIFKKSQTVSELQLNTIQISSDLSLNIDERKISYNRMKNEQHFSRISLNDENTEIVQKALLLTQDSQNLHIFHEIQTYANQLDMQLREIKNHNKLKQEINDFQGFQIPRQSTIESYIENEDFLQFIQQIAGRDAQKFKSQFADEQFEQRIDLIEPSHQYLKQIPIAENSQAIFLHEEYEDSQNPDEQQKLYEPQNDIFFLRSGRKQRRKHKEKQSKNVLFKRYRTKSRTSFKNSNMEQKQDVLKAKMSKQVVFNNNNLVPIKYVYVYESRSPFPKLRKQAKHQTGSYYKQSDLNINAWNSNFNMLSRQSQLATNYLGSKKLFEVQDCNYGVADNRSQFKAELPLEYNAFIETQKVYKNASMKNIKNQIKNQIQHERSFFLERPQSALSFGQKQTSLNQFSAQNENHIGFRFLRQKMQLYDPLDILVSMLHIAYEQQVLLQPIYHQAKQSKIQQSMQKLQDIVITINDI